jgi:hypothetical protein
MSLWSDIKSAASSAYDDATDSVVNWWEDSESAPAGYEQSVAQETSAAGNTATTIPSAQNNTGETISYFSAANTPYLIGGGVLLVVLVVFMLMLARGK